MKVSVEFNRGDVLETSDTSGGGRGIQIFYLSKSYNTKI